MADLLLLESGDLLLLENGDGLELEQSAPGTGNPWWAYAQQRRIMNSYLRQATAAQSRSIGPFISDTDFITPETGLTIANTDIKLVSNGGASANKNSGGATARVNGVYGITLDATDTATVGELDISVVVAGALPVNHTFVVLEEAVYDALFAAAAPGYLQPTTAGRTLDVSAGGEAGIDWANIGSPTTAVDLSATTIDVDQIVASVSGAVGSVTGSVGGNVAGNVAGNVTGSVGSLAAQAKADVNAEVVDALNVDTYAEPTGVPPATTTLQRKISQIYMVNRNGLEITTTDKTFFDDGGAAEWKKPITAVAGVSYTEGEGTTP